jgi:hypothetical protein
MRDFFSQPDRRFLPFCRGAPGTIGPPAYWLATITAWRMA